jgi:hypothetical protein
MYCPFPEKVHVWFRDQHKGGAALSQRMQSSSHSSQRNPDYDGTRNMLEYIFLLAAYLCQLGESVELPDIMTEGFDLDVPRRLKTRVSD